MKTVTKTIEDLEVGESPFPLSAIPNSMGVKLNSVESITWTKQDDGQLVSVTINFNQAKPELDPEFPSAGLWIAYNSEGHDEYLVEIINPDRKLVAIYFMEHVRKCRAAKFCHIGRFGDDVLWGFAYNGLFRGIRRMATPCEVEKLLIEL